MFVFLRVKSKFQTLFKALNSLYQMHVSKQKALKGFHVKFTFILYLIITYNITIVLDISVCISVDFLTFLSKLLYN